MIGLEGTLMVDPFQIKVEKSDEDGAMTISLTSLTKWLITGYLAATVGFASWLYNEKIQNREDMLDLRKDNAIIMQILNNSNNRMDRQDVRMDRFDDRIERKADKK